MTTKIALALATLAVASTSTPAFAADAPKGGGHFEWRYSPQLGPNKSNLPNYRRIWVADPTPNVAMDSGQCMTMACCDTGGKRV